MTTAAIFMAYKGCVLHVLLVDVVRRHLRLANDLLGLLEHLIRVVDSRHDARVMWP